MGGWEGGEERAKVCGPARSGAEPRLYEGSELGKALQEQPRPRLIGEEGAEDWLAFYFQFPFPVTSR